MESLPVYIVKLGQSYLSDYVGLFATKELAYQWITENDLDKENCQVIRLIPKNEY
ncbi:hypothetical protein [Cyanobacterium aponinum]|uniref:hypothetical protein n=1 Tax=Cyanobacterium aponinum TaxID=379064 RepID=UPI0013FDBFF5|nr:hypothetical protein [Cyanobacterium aponinum]